MKKSMTPAKNTLTPIASAVILLLMSGSVAAQEAAPKADVVQEVHVTGIRASLQQSINQKRNSDSLVEVVTAEDIGKMPDKNVADSIQRVPGVNISSSAGGEGGFDENDRVSIRGTSASLTQTLINGHTIGTGDWFILDQVGSVGRSVSYALLPSELVGQVTVHKSAEADQVEGGVAGSVDVATRKPLDFKKSLTMEGSIQAVYSDLIKKTDPQASALVNWKNDEKTMGVLVQLFSETRNLRRDGQELFYGTITAADYSAVVAAKPELEGVDFPIQIGSALFTQERKREGGAIEMQFKPSKDLTLGLSGLYSKLSAKNYNVNFLAWPGQMLASGVVPTSFTIHNNTLVAASFPVQDHAAGGQPIAQVDSIYRPGSGSSTSYINFDAKWRASKELVFTAQAGSTTGVGETTKEVAFEGSQQNGGLNYSMNGLKPATVTYPSSHTNTYTDITDGGSWGSQIKSADSEKYGQLDGEWALGSGIFEAIKFGARFTTHERKVDWPVAGQLKPGVTEMPAWHNTLYPSNFGNGFGGAQSNLWYLEPTAVEAWADKNVEFTKGGKRRNFSGEFVVDERTGAAYVMANVGGQDWRGNFGVRVVRTNQESTTFLLGGPNPIYGSDFAVVDDVDLGFTPTLTKHSYTNVLPSANLRFNLSKDLILRTALASTMARADFSALAGAVTLEDTLRTGSGGNPDLKPVKSTNFDASIEWYFAPKSLASLGVFYMDMSSFVAFGTAPGRYYNQKTKQVENYSMTAPINIGAKNKGFELSYQQPLGGNFGVLANFTYADGKAADGSEMVGNSKNTFNMSGYFENDKFNARLAYTQRSDFLVGLNNSFAQHEAGVGTLAASFNYNVNENVALSLEALNLNNPTLKYYGKNKDQLASIYSSGRQFYFGVRVKM